MIDYYLCTEGHVTWRERDEAGVHVWCMFLQHGGAGRCCMRTRLLTELEESAFRLGGPEALRDLLTGYEALALRTPSRWG